MKLLCIIPARGGSKGIPNKNRKLLNGKPLLFYSIDIARKILPDIHICVSTDDLKITALCEKYGLSIPFKRPAKISGDTANSSDVIAHALSHYASQGITYDTVLLLQPTSPFRTLTQVKEALKLYNGKEDMLVSVIESSSNPYYNLMEETGNGFLIKSKKTKPSITRRQDAPKVYEINGAIYVINVKSFLKKGGLGAFTRIKKYVMSEEASIDIDTPLDWQFAEFLLRVKNKKLQ